MNHDIVDTANLNLKRAERLIQLLDERSYSNSTSGPHYSSIGGHLRHVLDIFACIGYLLDLQGIELPDNRFGYNPTTSPSATG